MQTASGAGRIRGAVVDNTTGAPVPGALITAFVVLSNDPPMTTVTDASGLYVFAAVPAGVYTVTAAKPAYATAKFGRVHSIDPGYTLEVRPGQERRGVNFRLRREATLTGRIVAADGQPMPGLLVTTSRPHLVDGRKQLVSFGSARTDASGRYTVTALLPGDYYVSVALFEPGEPRASDFGPTFYPGTAQAATAVRVRVNAGATVEIDPITPLRVPYTLVAGRLKTFDNDILMTAAMIMQPAGAERLSFSPNDVVQILPDQQFRFNFVSPGLYVIRAQGNTGADKPSLFADWTVNGSAVAPVTMTLKPGSEISGRVLFDGHGTPPPADLAPIRVHMPLVDASGFAHESADHVGPDAAFELKSVDSGKRLVRVDGLTAPWSLERVTQGTRDITDVALAIVQGQRIKDVEITLTDVITGLTGRVHDAAGTELSNYMVLIFPVDRTLWRPLSRYILATYTDAEGQYRLASLPPGEYRVAAVDDVEESEMYDRETLDQASLRSVPLTLTSGVLATLDLTVKIGGRANASVFATSLVSRNSQR